jgi:drug/metabolite transporter (DMT)-like permease
MALFALAVVATCRTPAASRRGWRVAAEYSLVVLGMLLFSERTWKHHGVTLLLPFAALCYYVTACRPRPAVARAVGAVLALTALLMATTSTVFDKEFAKQAQVYGAYTVSFALLAATLAALLCTPRDPVEAPAKIEQAL